MAQENPKPSPDFLNGQDASGKSGNIPTDFGPVDASQVNPQPEPTREPDQVLPPTEAEKNLSAVFQKILAKAITMPFEICAVRFQDSRWSLDDSEVAEIDQALKAWLLYRAPTVMKYAQEHLGPELAFAATLVMIIGPRMIMEPQQIPEGHKDPRQP